ncbi:hypothetical protein ABW19_dt0205156 [Dactylella cylindrospora]|nr:hypothetical protein ABW19_dt0205156 [Dactylella cylindrospora]
MGRKDRHDGYYYEEEPYDSYQKYHEKGQKYDTYEASQFGGSRESYGSYSSHKTYVPYEDEEPYERYNPKPSRRKSRRYSKDYDGPGRSVGAGNKRLVIACDGTWQDSAGDLDDGKVKPPTNVTRICRAIKTESRSDVPQIVYYQAGPGTSNNPFDKIVGGAVGAGVAQNMRECFSFLSNNYTPGDEIFFIGFSRGAFTARSVASMVANLGILTKKGLEYFAVIMKDYQHRYEKGYKSPQPDLPFSNKPSAADLRYLEELYRRGMTIPNVRIKAIGVWDTVGALGIPRIGWLQKMGIQSRRMDEMMFYDTTLSPQVEYAFQALALDERRGPFSPTVWELPKGSPTVLKQTWMPGEHSNVGGGWEDQNLADVSLAWMISNLTPFLDFDDTYIHGEFEKNVRYYHKRKLKPRPWGFGKIHDSMDGMYALGGSETRTPGDYTRCDPTTGERTGKFLRNTRETIHVSVRTRIAMKGYGVDDEGYYSPKALRNWRFKWDEAARRYKWVNKLTGVELYEMDLGPVERDMVQMYPNVYDYIFDDAGGKYIDNIPRGKGKTEDGITDEVQQIAGVIKGLLK